MKRLRTVVLGVLILVAAGVVALTAMAFSRPGLEAYTAHHYVPPASSAGALTATWLGNTGVLLSDGSHALLIDPFFTRPAGLLPMLANRPIAPDEATIIDWLQRANAKRIDAVLVSHSHFDHAMDAGAVARLTGAQLLGSGSTLNIGRGVGLPEQHMRLMHSGDSASFGAFRVTFIESRHAGATGGAPTGDITQPLVPPARYADYRQGGTYSILVDHPQGRVLHHGSAGFVPGALKGRQADVVFLGVALIDDLPAYLGEVVRAVGAKRVVPIHWDDFTRPLDEPLQPLPIAVHLDDFFSDTARLGPDLAVQTLELNRPVALFPPEATP